MAEHRLTVKTAELLTPGNPDEPMLLDAMSFPIDGGKGNLFSVLRLAEQREDVREKVRRIVRTHLEHGAQTMAGEANIPRRFEIILSDINDALLALSKENPGMQADKFDAVVGVLTERQLFISGTGDLQALFLHKTADRRFVIYELQAQFASEEAPSWEKPFLTVLDGELHPGDIFYLAPPARERELSTSELRDILVTLPPEGALSRIRQFLPHDAPFAAMCAHVAEEAKSGVLRKMNPVSSLAALDETKATTANLLGEERVDAVVFVRRWMSKATQSLSAPGRRGYMAVLRTMAKALVQLLGAVVLLIIFVLRLLWRGILILANLVSRIVGRGFASGTRERLSAVPERFTTALGRLRSLPRQSKLIAGGVAVVALVLVVSIVFASSRQAARAAEAAFQETAQAIEEKTTEAEATLIYNDTAKAQALITEAGHLLDTLPTDSSAHTRRVEALRSSLATVAEKARKATPVETTVVAPRAAGDIALSTIAASADGLLAFAGDGSLWRVNELEHTFLKIADGLGALSGIADTASEDATVLAIDQSRHLAAFDSTTNTLKLMVSGTEGMTSVEDITLYNSALYALSSASQQIVRMRPQGDGYEAGSTWVSDRASDLTQARALAIDGDVYVLTAADVVRFKSGRETPWTHDALSPALNNPIDVWTNLSSKYLYILDKGEGRIVVYSKDNGSMVVQYVNEALKDAIGFEIREGQNTILFATPNAVLSFTASHLLQ